MSGIEAAGEMIGGAGAARALEPHTHGAGGDHGEGPDRCLNCGAALTGNFCASCGQKAHLHTTIGGLLHDIVHGVLHLDGKFWNTLPLLVWRPGKLTRDYIDGHRARYISPIAFYLFTVVAMFALVVSVGDIAEGDITLGPDAQEIGSVEEADARLEELQEGLDELEQEDFPGVSGARAGVRAEIDAVERRRAELGGDPSETGATVEEEADEGTPLIGQLSLGLEKAGENPSLFLYKAQTTAYKLSWLLIPLSLPFMWLLFPFSRRFGLYDHAVFVTYSISFMMLMVIVVGLVAKVVPGTSVVGPMIAAGMLYAAFHLYRQLKGTYELGRVSALVRTMLLSVVTWIVLSIFLGLMLALGAIG
ncbi:DUF3667 domain-containing protein [Sphingomicrobium sp. XHP0239]|uniref:DUF3667 domain-containing protein n=1 Tax=Sphingomicrobium maritimum TaxID=3133972 RepID=UPI0031CC6673